MKLLLKRIDKIFCITLHVTQDPKAYSAGAVEEAMLEPMEVETPYRQAVESKTLGIVRFAHEYHHLDLDGMMLDASAPKGMHPTRSY